MNYQLISAFQQKDGLRESFNELTEKTFGFNFKEWYQNGFWQEKYIPYSLAEGDKVIANVSVNLMDFIIDGVRKKYIQLGTVMTDKTYRNQGLGRYLMETVLKEYKDSCNGIYLFANNSAVGFYPKFGFTASREYQYSKKINSEPAKAAIRKVNMEDRESRERVLEVIKNPAQNNKVHMDNYGLYSFYAAGMMQDQIYYCESEAAYTAAEIRGNILFLNQIMAKHKVDLDRVIASFGSEVREVVLGFVPFDASCYEVKEYKDEDLTLFIMGKDLELFEKQKLRFPLLSHA